MNSIITFHWRRLVNCMENVKVNKLYQNYCLVYSYISWPKPVDPRKGSELLYNSIQTKHFRQVALWVQDSTRLCQIIIMQWWKYDVYYQCQVCFFPSTITRQYFRTIIIKLSVICRIYSYKIGIFLKSKNITICKQLSFCNYIIRKIDIYYHWSWLND